MIKDLTEENYHKIRTCFETLTEFIQGPCENNQTALADGNFIQIACGLLEVFISFLKLKALDSFFGPILNVFHLAK